MGVWNSENGCLEFLLAVDQSPIGKQKEPAFSTKESRCPLDKSTPSCSGSHKVGLRIGPARLRSDSVWLATQRQERFHRSLPEMRRFARQILMASLVILYGGVTAIGPALHSLPGFKHVPAALADLRGGSDSHPAPLVGSHDDCPVCHFLALGQILVDPDRRGRVEVVQIHPADEIPLIIPSGVRLPSHPRAPPLV